MIGNSSINEISLAEVWAAWRAFRLGKKATREILFFESELEDNLFSISEALNSKQYRHGGYQHRIVDEKKRRDIYVATVRDRVVHRIVYDRLVAVFDPKFDTDVWSCRKGKGLIGAAKRVQKILRQNSECHIWRGDIQKYFENINQSTILDILKGREEVAQILWLLEEIVFSYPKGVPIGNLTSQIFANIYLDQFDKFIRQLGVSGYVRYGDDFLVFGHSYRHMRQIRKIATSFLAQKLGLTLSARNNIIIRARDGTKFCGVLIYDKGFSITGGSFSRMRQKVTFKNGISYINIVDKLGSRRQQRTIRNIWGDQKLKSLC